MRAAGSEHHATLVAVYRRTIRASLTRIWENVLDWEHLPWLHRSSFLAIRLTAADRDGWRAEVTVPGPPAYEIGLEVRLDRANLCYTSSTIAGRGAGTEILTRLQPVAAHVTDIAVEFRVPGVSDARATAVGNAFVALYTQLWGEDEAMMMRRQAVLDGRLGRRADPPAVRLSLGEVAAVRARAPFTVDMNGQRVRVVVVDGALVAHGTVCPHLGGPLDDAPIDDGGITCPWHGYRFDVRTAQSCDGRSYQLEATARIEIDAHSQVFLTCT
ncbi:MAG TPA: Rieske (2Fe-2S) protein [Candidatus Binatia bacterium]|nr:Rieske (2Fe-2S) protein [Candidatus Binatia bacterium]